MFPAKCLAWALWYCRRHKVMSLVKRSLGRRGVSLWRTKRLFSGRTGCEIEGGQILRLYCLDMQHSSVCSKASGGPLLMKIEISNKLSMLLTPLSMQPRKFLCLRCNTIPTFVDASSLEEEKSCSISEVNCSSGTSTVHQSRD